MTRQPLGDSAEPPTTLFSLNIRRFKTAHQNDTTNTVVSDELDTLNSNFFTIVHQVWGLRID